MDAAAPRRAGQGARAALLPAHDPGRRVRSTSAWPPRVVPADDLADEVADARGAGWPPGPTVAYGAIRRSVEHAAGHDFAESLAFEAEMMALTGGTEDHRAAVDAFVAKQQPEFDGR